jgi:CheY-like chemotaxis protein
MTADIPSTQQQLVGRIANDLNDLLTVINSYAEMLLDAENLPEDFAEKLKRIYLAGERASNLTRQLFDIGGRAPPELALPEASAPGSQRGSETVLVVEDEESVRRLAVLTLQKLGYRVLEASTAAEALEVWSRHRDRIRVLITDVVMPGDLTGRDLAAQLQKKNPDLRVMFTTGYLADSVDIEPALSRNNLLLQKPYLPRQLAAALRTALDS